MLNFLISYEDAKNILALLYNLPYRNAVNHIDIMHSLKEAEGSLTLKEHVEKEVQLLNHQSSKEG